MLFWSMDQLVALIILVGIYLIQGNIMVSISTARQLALSFPDTDEHPHFERKAFRVRKKIFATLLEKEASMNIKLTPEDQSVFCLADPAGIQAVPNKWGLQGWTTFHLKKARKSLFVDALTTAWRTTAPPKLAATIEQKR